jgi:hypothetical protein
LLVYYTSRKRLKACGTIHFYRRIRLSTACAIFSGGFRVFQTTSYDETTKIKVIKLCSWQLFYLKSFRLSKIVSKFVKFKIQILQTTSDEKSVKMKVVEHQNLFNFVVDNVFIWIRLRSQTSNLHSFGCNMWPTKLKTIHKACHRRSGREGYMWRWGRRACGISGPRPPLIKIIFFAIFKICFMFSGNDFHWRFYYVDRDFHWRSSVTRL